MLKEIIQILAILAILALVVMIYREMWYIQFSEEDAFYLGALWENLPHR